MKAAGGLPLLSAAVVAATTISYDAGYDIRTRSLAVTACSDGANGLITKHGWQTQGDVPSFPHIGGWEGVAGWNSPNCGTCLAVTYNNKTVNILAVDHTDHGLNIAQAAMDELTGGIAVQIGRIDAKVEVVGPEACGMASKKRSEAFA